MKNQYLFENSYKECPNCRRSLPLDYPEEFCPMCMDQKLFNEVRDYIRENNVNEHEVAEHFQLPLAKIRTWIREGRIEYKEAENVISGQFCRRCGKTIFSGYFCPTCERFLSQGSGHVMRTSDELEAHRMHYLEKDNEDKGRTTVKKKRNPFRDGF